MKRRFRDLALYVAIAVGIVGGLVTLPLWVSEGSLPSREWFTFIVATGFLCLFTGSLYWHRRKSLRLWVVLVTILIAHVLGYSVLLEHVQHFPDALFLITVPLEAMLIILIVKLCLNIMPQRVKL